VGTRAAGSQHKVQDAAVGVCRGGTRPLLAQWKGDRRPRRANAQGCRGFKASNYETGVLRSQEGLGTGVMGAGIGCLSLITANLRGAGGRSDCD
jgi:hypothetical protein